MAVLNNTGILAGSSAVTDGGDDYQIANSIRLAQDRNAHFSRTFPWNGNLQKWTYSGWVKRSTLDNNKGHELFSAYGDGNNRGYIRFENENIVVDGKVSSTHLGTPKTSNMYRDPSAWMHICIVMRNNNANPSTDRILFWVNGVKVDQVNTWTSGVDNYWNRNIKHYLGAYPGDPATFLDPQKYFDGYWADVHFIDGFAYGPACFGKFDASGLWVPIALNIPKVNDGTTWSGSGFSGDAIDSNHPAAHLFDGHVANMNENGSQFESSGNAATIHWAPSTGIKYTQGIRVNCMYDGIISINDGEHVVETTDDSGLVWVNVVNGSGTLDKITFDCIGAHVIAVEGIEVDGQLLVDGTTSPTFEDWKSINNRVGKKKWSEFVSGSLYGSKTANLLFTGDYRDSSLYSSEGGTAQFKPNKTITASSQIRLYMFNAGSADTNTDNLHINGSSQWNAALAATGSADYGWYTISGTTIDSTNGIQWKRTSGSSQAQITAIEVDGVILTDSTNSFALQFKDTTSNRLLGRDTFNGKISEATGAKPILKTTDDWGDVTAGAVDTSDSNKSNLVFAWPGNSTTSEVHHTVKGSGSAKTVNSNGDPATDTSTCRLYGTSVAFDRTGDYLDVDGGTDFNFGTGDYCIECWFMTTDNTVNEGLFVLSDTSGGLATDESAHITVMVDSNGLDVRPGDGTTTAILGSNVQPENNNWHHIALTRASGTFRAFYDGALLYTKTGVTTSHADQYLAIGGYYSTSYLWKGNIQDFRIYKGAAKYTSDFNPPCRNDWQVHNINAVAPTAQGMTFSGVSSTGQEKSFKLAQNSYGGGPLSAMIKWNGDVLDKKAYVTAGDPNSVTFDPVIKNNGEISVYAGAYSNSNAPWTLTVTYEDDSTATNSGGTASNEWMFRSSFNTSGKSLKKIEIDGTGANAGWASLCGVSTDNSNHLVTADFSTNALIDVYTDSPTSYGKDESSGGTLRGNFCTFNNNDLRTYQESYITGGGLISHSAYSGSAFSFHPGTIAFPSNDSDGFYFELEAMNDTQGGIGLWDVSYGSMRELDNGYPIGHQSAGDWGDDGGCAYWTNKIYRFGTDGGSVPDCNNGASIDDGETLQCFVKDNKIWFGRANDWCGFGGNGDPSNASNPCITLTETRWLVPVHLNHSGGTSRTNVVQLNAGQKAWKYTPPTGAKAICTSQLADTFADTDFVNDPSKVFDVIKWSGRDSAQTLYGLGFQPDLVLIKTYGGEETACILEDVVRGAGKTFVLNNTDASLTNNSSGHIDSFNSNGYTISGEQSRTNKGGRSHVGWNWDAGTAASGANTTGSIDIASGDQWVNQDAGFSISKYTGTQVNDTIGHGLTAAPEFMIFKVEDGGYWVIWHKYMTAANNFMKFDTGADQGGAHTNGVPTSSIINLGESAQSNKDGYANYCWAWHGVEGYSKFGRYQGQSGKPFIYTGFQPKCVIVKGNAASKNWNICDSTRSPNNGNVDTLRLNTEDQQQNQDILDFCSNGFNIVKDDYGDWTADNDFIYAAFAEHPFKNARAQ